MEPGAGHGPYLALQRITVALGAGSFQGEVPEEWRQFVMIRMTGWTEPQYESASAHFCDRALRFESMEAEAAARNK